MSKNKYYKKINLDPDEKILHVIVQAPITKLGKIFIGVILILLPFFLLFTLLSAGSLGVAILLSLIIVALIYILREYYVWSHNVFILTDKKIVDVDQRGFFSKTVSEVPYTKVQDVAYSSKGVIASLFNTGDILIKTSVPDLSLQLKHVAKAAQVMGQIRELVEVGGGHFDSPVELSSREKMENFQDFLYQEDLEKYGHYKIKDLVNEYIAKYSKLRLKKLLVESLSKNEKDESTTKKKFTNKKN